MQKTKAFTYAELSVVIVISLLILFVGYKFFFAQTDVISQSMEFMYVNDSYRKLTTFIGDDIREATEILKPDPVMLEDVDELVSTEGVVLHLKKTLLDPYIPFNSPFGGQISAIHHITYRLEPIATTVALSGLFRLIRTESIESSPGDKVSQKQVITDNIKELVLYRTTKRPFKPNNIGSIQDRLMLPMPFHQSGTGNNLVHMKVILERTRKDDEANSEVYAVEMKTSFFKRGKEIFKNL